MASMLATKPKKSKKTGKVEPLRHDVTELQSFDRGLSPRSEFGDISNFDADSERGDRPISAFTDETHLIDSRANSVGMVSQPKDTDETSSRSSTPSSTVGLMKKLKKNTVAPIDEETSFVYENLPNIVEPWSEKSESRPSSAPQKERESDTNAAIGFRPQSAPLTPKLLQRNNKVSPARKTSPYIALVDEDSDAIKELESVPSSEAEHDNENDKVRMFSAASIRSTDLRANEDSIPESTKMDAWEMHDLDGVEKTDIPEKELIKLDDESIKSMQMEAILAPPQSSGENQAYIPIDMAKGCIETVIEDMKKMKANHYAVVEKIQEQYKLIEEETQAQFNTYVIKLRDEYSTKVATFKHVLESHNADFARKQTFYEEAIKSLRDKNRSLLIEKRQHLLKMKDDNAKHEKEKLDILKDLTGMLDEKHKEYVILRGMHDDEKKEKEIAQNENSELKVEIINLKKEIEDLRSALDTNSDGNKTLLATLDTEKTEHEETKKKLEEKTSEYAAMSEEKGIVDSQLAEKTTLIDEKDKSIAGLQLQLKESQRPPGIDRTSSTTYDDVSQLMVIPAPIPAPVERTEATTSSTQLDTVDAAVSAVQLETTDTATSAASLETDDATTSLVAVPVAVPVASDGTVAVDNELKKKISLQEEIIREKEGSLTNLRAKVDDKDEIIRKKEGTLTDLRAKVDDKDESIEKLENDIEEIKSKHKVEKEKQLDEIKDVNNERNTIKMELLDAQEQNRVLHARLETMLNEVADSVNIDEVQTKLESFESTKSSSEAKIEEENKKIEIWEKEFQEKNGALPTEDDRPDEIKQSLLEIKTSNEQLKDAEKDITVMNMLLDGTLPDDMKQEDNADKSVDLAIEDLKKQHEKEQTQLNEEINGYKNENTELENEKNELKTLNRELEEKIKELEEKIDELESREPERVVVTETVAMVGTATDNSEAMNELKNSLAEAEARIQELEVEHTTELDAEKKQSHKLQKKLTQQQSAAEKLAEEKREVESQLKVATEAAEAELKVKQESLDQAKNEIVELKEKLHAKLPTKAKNELKALQEKLNEAEAQKDGLNQEILTLNTKITELTEQLANTDVKVKGLEEKEVELQKLQEVDKKYKDLKKKYKTLEAKKTVVKAAPAAAASPAAKGGADPEEMKKLQKKIAELEKKVQEAAAKDNAAALAAKKDGKKDATALAKAEKTNETLKGKVEALTTTGKADAEKIKDLEQKLRDAKENDKNAKKQEKAMKEFQKKLEGEEAKTAKYKENFEKEKAETARLTAEVESLQSEIKKNSAEIATLGVAAKDGIEAAEQVKELKSQNKKLIEENNALGENYNTERILRKKYYNMVEDMKGKIRVYARQRPLSKSELDRGNTNIITSPDEYTCIVQTARGPKDFQYDAVFTHENTQEDVFADTSRLIQSAVDGYNVCIFAYGQTGSGKTFTMIGDKEQRFPGIAPRSFKGIYELIEENKSKFTFTTTMYMMELYRDQLIDLFGNTKNPAKLDIKKDKKGMVVVGGAVIQEAHSSEELMELFETGASARHVASTKMNAESSRSHLVLGIIIESTNMSSGAVVKGKLSLVDLAGSERAAKTGATPEQLKEAQSINKSLSALGDVISALSSEQSFIPYRNNKLTMLMQDSLGGNAKTLMFVNISPADYNCDETITSLTYASRVKLITNDAAKNSDNKEIAKLKSIIAKLKSGEHVDDEEIE